MTSKKRTSGGAGRSGEQRYAPREQFRDEKRAQFQPARGRPPQKNNNVLVYGIIGAAVVLVIAFIFMSNQNNATAGGGSAGGGSDSGAGVRRASAAFTPITPQNGEIRLAKAQFEDKKARFYTINEGGKEIDFFVLKSTDGKIRAAIDSCDVCFQARKGYRQEGDEMVCNNCNLRFPSVKINEVKGGCNPAPLTRTEDGDSVVIKAADIVKDNVSEAGQPLF